MADDVTDLNLNQAEKEELYKYLTQSGVPTPDEKHNQHTFLYKVATADDTTKVGFLQETEIGTPKYPTRALKNMALICTDVIGNKFISDYFAKQSEILTSTSLSRDGFLDKLAVTTTKQVADITKKKNKPKKWFGKEAPEEEKSFYP